MDTEYETANPLLYEKKRFKSFCGKQVPLALLCAVPIVGAIIYSCVIVRNWHNYEGKTPDEDSLYFGQNNVDDYKCDRKRHKAHTAIFSLLLIFSVAAFFSTIIFSFRMNVNWAGKGADSILPMLFAFAILISYYAIVASILQLLAPRLFKYTIREYACPTCHFANTIEFIGETEHKFVDRTLFIGTKSRSIKSTATFDDGEKVTIETPLEPERYSIKETREMYQTKYKCSHCGNAMTENKSKCYFYKD